MLIRRDSERDIQVIFDDYAGPDEFQFNKTIIPVRLTQYGNGVCQSSCPKEPINSAASFLIKIPGQD